MAVRAVCNISAMLFFSPIHSRMGTVGTYQLSMAFWPVTVAFFPILNVLARKGLEGTAWFNAVVGLFFIIWSIAGISWSKFQNSPFVLVSSCDVKCVLLRWMGYSYQRCSTFCGHTGDSNRKSCDSTSSASPILKADLRNRAFLRW